MKKLFLLAIFSLIFVSCVKKETQHEELVEESTEVIDSTEVEVEEVETEVEVTE
jgi:uncharacterized protein YcfL